MFPQQLIIGKTEYCPTRITSRPYWIRPFVDSLRQRGLLVSTSLKRTNLPLSESGNGSKRRTATKNVFALFTLPFLLTNRAEVAPSVTVQIDPSSRLGDFEEDLRASAMYVFTPWEFIPARMPWCSLAWNGESRDTSIQVTFLVPITSPDTSRVGNSHGLSSSSLQTESWLYSHQGIKRQHCYKAFRGLLWRRTSELTVWSVELPLFTTLHRIKTVWIRSLLRKIPCVPGCHWFTLQTSAAIAARSLLWVSRRRSVRASVIENHVYRSMPFATKICFLAESRTSGSTLVKLSPELN